MVSGGVAPRILNLCTRLRLLFNLTPQPLYPGTDWREGWMDPSRMWLIWKGEKLFHLLGILPQCFSPPSAS
jgi:hypothetical protein